jgi:DNA-binding transcriptional MerR regulator
LRSGGLARRAGVSADTLRAYERRGLLPAPRRTQGGYRLYPPEALERVQLIQRALAFGFTLPELVRFLSARASGRAPCRDVRSVAEARLRDVDAALAELSDLRASLAGLLAEWDARLSRGGDGAPRRFLETLPTFPTRTAAGAVAARRFSRHPKPRDENKRKEKP